MKPIFISQLLKSSLLMAIVDDEESRYMIHHEYDTGSDMIDLRFDVACRAGDLVGYRENGRLF